MHETAAYCLCTAWTYVNFAFISSEIMLHGSSAYAETHGRYEQYVLKGSQRRVQGAAEPKLLPVLGISNQFTATDKKRVSCRTTAQVPTGRRVLDQPSVRIDRLTALNASHRSIPWVMQSSCQIIVHVACIKQNSKTAMLSTPCSRRFVTTS